MDHASGCMKWSPSSSTPSPESIIRMPCHAMTIVASAMNSPWPNRRNSGSWVVSRFVIACWIVGMRFSAGCGSIAVLHELWLAPGAECVTGANRERLVRVVSVPPRRELHVDGGRFGVTLALAVDEELLDHSGEQLHACLALPCPEQDGPADLVEHSRGALLVRGVDDVRLKRIDRTEFLLAAVESKLPRVMGRRDRGGIGQVNGRQTTCQRATRGRTQAAEALPRCHDWMGQVDVGRASGIAKDQ